MTDVLTIEKAAAMIDHTYLKPYATAEDIKKLCGEAVRCGFKSVAVNPYPVKMCRELLRGSGVLTGAAIAFPLGQTTVAQKEAEARMAIADGAQEFDYVLNIGRLKEQDEKYIEDEMRVMTALAREKKVTCKVIFETCYLTEEEIVLASRIARNVGPDFVKTSTGFGPAGADKRHVALMKAWAGPEVRVKAAGGIRTWEDMKTMIDAGAERIGTSSGVRIIEELRTELDRG